MSQLYRKLPKTDHVLAMPELDALRENTPYPVFLAAVRNAIDALRELIREHNDEKLLDAALQELPALVEKHKELLIAPRLKKVINATGVVLHTNLGRAVLDEGALAALSAVSSGYSNLEYDLKKGERGSRYDHLIERVRMITGAEDAMVVNNNAAAVMLVLSTAAKGKEVITSRGELIEIGGSFRIPSVMEESGAILREVGTTNKTHGQDYRNALNEETAALLRVHTSNYKVVGFTSGVEREELVRIRDDWEKETGVRLPLIEDLGSGVLVDLSKYGLPKEPTVQEALAQGMDIVTFSGDKLLGGPQAGIIAGRADWIARMRKNQLTRALRVDKFTISVLEYTLSLYLDPATAIQRIPTLRMLTEAKDSINKRAEELCALLNAIDGLQADVVDIDSKVGGGSLPEADLPSRAVRLHGVAAQKLERALREQPVPVVVRQQDECVHMDVRTIAPGELTVLCDMVRSAWEAIR